MSFKQHHCTVHVLLIYQVCLCIIQYYKQKITCGIVMWNRSSRNRHFSLPFLLSYEYSCWCIYLFFSSGINNLERWLQYPGLNYIMQWYKGRKKIRNHSKATRIERDGGQIQDNRLLSGFSLSFYCYQRRDEKHYNFSSLLFLEVPASFWTANKS